MKENEILTPYDAGYDCGLNGANLINSSYRWFSTDSDMKMWSAGKHDGENEKFKGKYGYPKHNKKDLLNNKFK